MEKWSREKVISEYFWILRERPIFSPQVTNQSRSACNRKQSEREFIWRYSFISSIKMRSLALKRMEVAELIRRAKKKGDRTAP